MSTAIRLEVNNELWLRQIGDNDATVLFEQIEQNRNYLRRYLNWVDQMKKTDDARKFIQTCHQRTADLKGITFVISLQEKIIGSIALYDWIHETKCIHMGYWISQAHSNKGMVTRCAEVLLSYVFGELEMEKVQLYFLPENTASERIADKLGFKIEGYIRKSFMLHGILKDQYLAGLIREEYLNRCNPYNPDETCKK